MRYAPSGAAAGQPTFPFSTIPFFPPAFLKRRCRYDKTTMSAATREGRGQAKIIHIYNIYNMIMQAVKRIPVTEPVWKDLSEMRAAGQTYAELLADMIEERKKRRLEDDVRMWENLPDSEYVPLSEIKD